MDPTTILVKFKDPAAAATKVQRAADRPLGLIPGARVEVVKLQRGESVAKKLAEYRARDDVLFAEPNYVLRPEAVPTLTPNDPMLGSQWGLSNISAPAGWAVYPGTFSSLGGVKIAIVDTGIYAGHADLAGRVLAASGAGCLGSGFICSSGFTTADDFGHGTHVAGIAGAVADNGVGVAGMAVSSQLIPVKVCFGTVVGLGCPIASISSGIAWAVAKGAKVINLSLGGPGAGTLCAATASAIAKGVTIVAAAGNSGINAPTYPAACPGVIGVAADANDNDSAYYSNWDYPDVFVSAPGGLEDSAFDNPLTEILSTVPFKLEDGSPAQYESIQGTSMASPFVAGLAAMMKSERPLRTPADIRRALAKTADKVLSPTNGDYGVPYGGYGPRGSDPFHVCAAGECTWHPFWGYGQINAYAALRGAAPRVTSFTPVVGTVGTIVTITGEDLAAATEVSFGVGPTPSIAGTGRTSTLVATPSENSIKVAVPDGGITGPISVKTPGGASTSVGVFKVSPKVTGFEPVRARRLVDPVTIHGKNFTGATVVKIGSVVIPGFVVVDDETITAALPATAVTGKVSVTTPSGTGLSGANLVVILPPTISGFAPASGAVGAVVTVNGSNLDSVESGTLNGADVGVITHVSAASVRFTVFDGATSGKISLTNTAGTATSVGVFKVSPRITGFEPASAKRGDTVTVHGENFAGATVVKVGSVLVTSFVVTPATLGDDTITLTVPATAVTGKVSVTTPAGTGLSTTNLIIILPPAIASFAPTSGGGGATVTINGANLGGATDVRFGGDVSATFTSLSATSLQAVVPTTAVTGPITVQTPGGNATTATPFTVNFHVVDFAPASGAIGNLITVNGTGMGTATLVEFNGIPTLPVMWTPTSVSAYVPPGTTDGPITVKSATGASSTSATDFHVIGVLSFEPAYGAPGSTVTIHVTGLSNPTAVQFNGWYAPPITVSPDKTEITATIPWGPTSGPITVWNTIDSTTTPFRSGADFEVLAINSLSPSWGTVGTPVTINGSGFQGATAVTFGGASVASFSVNAAGTRVTTTVPGLAKSGRVVVETPRGAAEMGPGAPDFAVYPTITSFSPQLGPLGTEVHIAGTGFAGAVGVFFGFTASTFTVNGSATEITASASAPGYIRVASTGATDDLSDTPFSVTP